MENIRWFGHASFSFVDINTGSTIYYIDPFQLPYGTKKGPLEKGDIIFITHAHHDHLSSQDITPLLKEDTVIVATQDSLETLNIANEKYPVTPFNNYEVKGFKFKTVPAYNIRPERLSYHPKENGWVGYIFTINGLKIYHAGDTDFIPEMNDLKKENLDIAFLPIGGTYTMTAEEAANAANAIVAKITIPMHYKMLLRDKAFDSEEIFKKSVTASKVVILEEFK